jgi:8-oxo-dGTP pyrophosphatase MutT (NUDIX family)
VKLEVAALTSGQPFCAGLLLVHRGRRVLTLNDDGLPAELAGKALRVGAVGGGQEPGEDIWECALREAHEETSVAADLVPSPRTWFYDWETREPVEVERVEDETAPLVLHRWERPNPDVAYKPGLPTGPYLYGADFLALAGDAADLRPGDDVAGLLLVPFDDWSVLDADLNLGDAVASGAEVVEARPLDAGLRLWVHPHEGLYVARPLLDEPDVRSALGR